MCASNDLQPRGRNDVPQDPRFSMTGRRGQCKPPPSIELAHHDDPRSHPPILIGPANKPICLDRLATDSMVALRPRNGRGFMRFYQRRLINLDERGVTFKWKDCRVKQSARVVARSKSPTGLNSAPESRPSSVDVTPAPIAASWSWQGIPCVGGHYTSALQGLGVAAPASSISPMTAQGLDDRWRGSCVMPGAPVQMESRR